MALYTIKTTIEGASPQDVVEKAHKWAGEEMGVVSHRPDIGVIWHYKDENRYEAGVEISISVVVDLDENGRVVPNA